MATPGSSASEKTATFDALFTFLDALSVACLMLKIVYYRSGRGLSIDMLICTAVAAVLFVVPYAPRIFGMRINRSVLLMILYAAIICYCLAVVLRLRRSKLEGNEATVPRSLRWYSLVAGSTLCSVVLAYLVGAKQRTPIYLLVPLYVDAAGKIPQLYLLSIQQDIDCLTGCFLASMIASRVVEAISWIYMWSFTDILVLGPIIFQALFGIDFLVLWVYKVYRRTIGEMEFAFLV